MSSPRLASPAHAGRHTLGAIGLFLAVVAGYEAGVAITFKLNQISTTGQAFFLSTGVSVAALLLAPKRLRPAAFAAVAVAELAEDLVNHRSVPASLGYTIADSVGPLVVAAIIWYLISDQLRLTQRRHLLVFVLATVVGTAVDGLIGATTTVLTSSGASIMAIFPGWMTGDALGVLIVGAAIIAWFDTEPWPVRPAHAVAEAAVLAAAVGVLGWLVFWRWNPPLAYLIIPLLGWAAVRFGPRGATLAGVYVAMAADWASVSGRGLFAHLPGSEHDALIYLQVFLAVALLTSLFVAAQVADLSRAQRAIGVAAQLERQRLARELHDSVSQALFSMTMHAQAAELAIARQGLPPDGPLGRAITQLRDLTRGALAEMRLLIFELRPSALTEEGLLAAVHKQAAALSAREQLPITVTGPAERLNLESKAEEHLYRIVLEALHNTVKHAGASQAAIDIAATAGQITVTVTDNGHGFDPAAVQAGHLGLQTMRDRAAAIGAKLHISAASGQGTTLTVHLPGPAPSPSTTQPPSSSHQPAQHT